MIILSSSEFSYSLNINKSPLLTERCSRCTLPIPPASVTFENSGYYIQNKHKQTLKGGEKRADRLGSLGQDL